jgi:chorismate mutase / prephenate dehydratase
MTKKSPSLDDLRHRIDTIDDQLQDLLIKRAEVVEAIGGLKKNDQTPPLRPGREARLLRRLVARHRGRFPRPMLVRIWRELLSGMLAMQTDFQVAVYVPGNQAGYWDLARDHYGSHTPMIAYRAAGEVVGAVSESRALLGVLPMPVQGGDEMWWRLLIANDASKPRVIARLPFAGRGNARDGEDALVIARTEPEASGGDRSLYAFETGVGMSRARLAAAFPAAGLAANFLAAFQPSEDTAASLFDFDEWLAPSDPRLERAMSGLGDKAVRVTWLGGYAKPLTAAALDNAPAA